MRNANQIKEKGKSSSSKKRADLSPHEELRIDKVLTTVIRSLDLLIAQASSAEVGTVARILHTAKEDLVYWAVQMNFHETDQEKFFNRLMYPNAMFAAADFIQKLDDPKNTKKILANNLPAEAELVLSNLVETLRKTA